MKKLLVIALAGITSMSVYADNTDLQKRISQEHKNIKIEKISKELSLTASQIEQMEGVQTDYVNSLNALKDSSMDREELRAEKRELNKIRQEKVNSILTPEQRAQAEKLKYAHQEKGKKSEKISHGKKSASSMTAEERADRMTEKMAEVLGLDEEQQKNVAAINLKYAEKQASLDRGKDMRSQIMDLRMQQKAELSSVLTKEQIDTIERIEAKRAEMMRNKKDTRSKVK